MAVGIAIVVASVGPALAAPRDDALNEMLRCAKMADAGARHACFDAAIPQLRAAAETAPVETATAPAPSPSTQSAPAAANAEPQQAQEPEDSSIFASLGSLNPFAGSDKPPSQQQMSFQPIGQELLPLTIGVADYTTGPHGYTVTLDNGQVWQNYPRLVDAPPLSASQKNVVIIEHGLLGGYTLTVKGRGAKVFKVVRVK